ncbi:hypothetical protein ABVK25_009206 [Lepraria finkii]|uniref:Uncharacterized protein n=1 Tax=Lepraria finkii TaxID=1340010 RepID=A0ABR4AZY6_9LECA
MNWHRPKTADGNLLSPAHKVSFSDSSKSSEKRNSARPSSRPSSSSNSRGESPAGQQRRGNSQQKPATQKREQLFGGNRNLQHIDRQSEALRQSSLVSPTAPQPKPFLIYHDSFLSVLGLNPTLQCLIEDNRAPFFHEAGIFHPPTNTLFVTSNQLEDSSPTPSQLAIKQSSSQK